MESLRYRYKVLIKYLIDQKVRTKETGDDILFSIVDIAKLIEDNNVSRSTKNIEVSILMPNNGKTKTKFANLYNTYKYILNDKGDKSHDIIKYIDQYDNYKVQDILKIEAHNLVYGMSKLCKDPNSYTSILIENMFIYLMKYKVIADTYITEESLINLIIDCQKEYFTTNCPKNMIERMEYHLKMDIHTLCKSPDIHRPIKFPLDPIDIIPYLEAV
jgi:hypothetical protein